MRFRTNSMSVSLSCALAIGTAAAAGFHHHAAVHDSTFDYVVVGGGTSGLVVANRLTENHRTTVLVIERGYFDDKPEAIIPWYANAVDTSVLLSPQSAPNPKLNNATRSVTVAAVVGGATVVNGMGCDRGSRADYDAWEELGNPGWGWNGLLPYFKKSTNFTPPNSEAVDRWNMTWDPSAYGKGPVQIHISNFQYPDIDAIWEGFRQQPGVTFPPGASSGSGPGAYWTPNTVDARDMTRSTARSAYYDTVNKTRTNLRLVIGQTATKLLFDRGKPLRAKGVRVVSSLDGKIRNVYARKEVILAAGAVMTPHLLQVSGIGPAAALKAAGVKVKKDLPSVGANFQDHATIVMWFNLSTPTFPNPDSISTNATYNATVWEEYFTNKTGPIAAANSNSIIYYSLSQVLSPSVAASIASRLLAQDARQFLPSIYSTNSALLRGFIAQRAILAQRFKTNTSSYTTQPLRGNGQSPSPLLKPLSRGSVTLNLTHPESLPVVQYNTFMNPIDEELAVAVVRRSRRYWASPALQKLGPTERQPGAQYQTDAEILNYLKANPLALFASLAHPSGTCAMMPEKLGGCVGSDLRVYGVKGLSVVDASVIPLISGTSLQATVYAIAEKAADIIKARRG
ncbi:putative GMC oxidoreductase [Triangularia setosa]|uniref:GMC oxidoreductase n=1 Tax=Triangularia setosa TaxID=2587417 RepID=A0AAN7A7E6_9PEZI|nr:putative GMC oxidoreductase [Podospora setosa]